MTDVQLQYRHLMRLLLDVDWASVKDVGKTPAGVRRIASVKGGRFTGERLSGAILEGADWVIARPDGVTQVDVRLTLQTDDGAFIYLTYQGLLRIKPEDMQRIATGEPVDPSDWSLVVKAKFECGAERYAWLNDVIAVGKGVQTPTGPGYEFFQMG